ncbi:radical SAM family heme chaperone HemW [Rhodobacteraceae bacterium]|nr:radical SAM family heme chaperone HemW [Paracoccaceae bacterium]
MTADWQNGGFGLYIHWPFCAAKCPYCDFNSHVSNNIDNNQWLRSYLSELTRAASETQGRVLNSIFFGGGTPSLMAPELVHAILDHVRTLWPQSNDIECTLEANPGSVEAGRFRGYADAGVNRISMGIQALNDPDLKRLGRIHSVSEAKAAFDTARQIFDRVSFDLIYARQDQTLDAWRNELTEALAMSIDHLSLYQLTIEQGTAFGDRYNRGKLRGLPTDDAAADMYELTQDLCDAAGMPAYEVSNHARDGAHSRHNLIYWRYGDYIGIGPGAHGRITLGQHRYATETRLAPNAWLQHVAAGNGEALRTAVSRRDQGIEYVMMGLRLVDGISHQRYRTITRHDIDQTALDHLSEIQMIHVDGDKIRATRDGRAVLNSVIATLLPED